MDMDSYSDTKPVSLTTHQCLHCGFIIEAISRYMYLEELNYLREDYEMDMLKELPEQNYSL
jgi:hypothetical protein